MKVIRFIALILFCIIYKNNISQINNKYPFTAYHYFDSHIVFDITIDTVPDNTKFMLKVNLRKHSIKTDTVYYYNLTNWTVNKFENSIYVAISDQEGDFHTEHKELIPLYGSQEVSKLFSVDLRNINLLNLRFSYFLNSGNSQNRSEEIDSLGMKHFFADSGFPIAGKYFEVTVPFCKMNDGKQSEPKKN